MLSERSPQALHPVATRRDGPFADYSQGERPNPGNVLDATPPWAK